MIAGSEVVLADAVVAGNVGAIVMLPKIGGSVVAASAGADVVAATAGVIVVAVSDSAAHPATFRSSMHARCSGYDHGPPGLSTCATKAAHSSGCSSSMQQSTPPIGSRQSSLTSQGAVEKHCLGNSTRPGHTALQAANGSTGSGADVVTPVADSAGAA